jgi:hypothetical protein
MKYLKGGTFIVPKEAPLEDWPIEPPFHTLAMAGELHTPWILAPKHLELIFEIQKDMIEKLHRYTLLSSIIDLLLDTLSCIERKQIFPTYAQPYVFTPQCRTLDACFHSSFKV